MSKKRTIILLLNIIFVILLSFSTVLYINSKLSITTIYIAKYSLPSRTLISEDEIEEVKVPYSYLNEQVILDKDEIIGKYVKIDTTIPKGSFFYVDSLEELENMKDGLLSELDKNEVSLDIEANKINVNQAYLKKGMYVDVYLTINKDRVVSDLLINNLKIIGLYDINNKEIKDYDNDSILGTLSLAVPVEAINYLNKASVIGQLSIVVGNNPYTNVKTQLNKNGYIFEYLD